MSRVQAVCERLSNAGHRVGVADMAEYGALPDVNGFVLVNWGAHANRAPCASRPAALRDEVERRFGAHPVGEWDAVDENPRRLRRLKERVLEGVRRHRELHRWLMRDQPWDVFFAGFSAPHCIAHHFWHDAGAPDPHGVGGALEQVYHAIDEEIGHMQALVGDDVRVMVVAGHGMGPLYHASWSLPEILATMIV